MSRGKYKIWALYFSKITSGDFAVAEKKKWYPEGVTDQTYACEGNSIGIFFFLPPIEIGYYFYCKPFVKKSDLYIQG